MTRNRIAAIALVVLAIVAARPAEGNPLAFDVQQSKMTVHVGARGLFAFLADNHVIDAPITSGSYDTETKVVQLTVDAAKMLVLDPKLSADRRDQVQANMTGSQVLDAEKYPTISFRSTKIDDTDPNRWTVTGDLTLHGQTHPIEVQVHRADAMHFLGSATIRQTTFGITPIRVAGGTVSVKDDVDVEFEIVLRRSG
jgi:polyisoprenoid-binding protein YceI